MELYIIEVSLYEIGLSQGPELHLSPSTERLETLWRCLRAAKSWFDTFLSIQPAQYIGLSVMSYAGIARCFFIIYFLSIYEHPDWDLELVRKDLDVSKILEATANNFNKVKEAAGLQVDGHEAIDSFSIIASKFEAYKAFWDSNSTPQIPSSGVSLGEEKANDISMPLFDEDWLNQIFGQVID